MNKYLRYIALMLIFTGCEDVIVKRELDAVDNLDVWNDPELANLYLNGVYGRVLPGFDGNSNTNLSDEASDADMGTVTSNMIYGQLQLTDQYGNFGVGTYSNIRDINFLLEEIDKGQMEEEDKDLIKGQALFLRAWVYWEMVKLYGGVPMVMATQHPDLGDALRVRRDPAATCIDLIVQDLDAAIDMLPPSWTERGRVTRAAAAALKGRVLLFYASPQFNPDNLPERWTAAYDANKEAKRICEEDGYALYDDFANIFLDEEETKEAIFITVYDGINKAHGYENGVRPASVSNEGTTGGNPTWELVKAFPMIDGRSIDEHPDYDSLTFWKNRDPRFYATIAYNSVEWKFEERASDRQWTYIGNTQEPTGNTTNTGFYLRKNINTSIPKTETGRTGTDWIEIRFAEVLLNLAECANEVGQQAEALAELKAIRERAGILPGVGNMYGLETGMTKEEMREAIMLERQIELAFENKRHWDLRRRNLYASTLNGNRRHGIQVVLDTAYITATYPAVESDDALTFFETNIRDSVDWENNHNVYFNIEFGWERDERDINFLQPKYNFYYLPQADLERNPNLQQTIHWGESDPFDPLAP